MAKLTNRQKASLERVLYHLKRAETYILSEQVAICMHIGKGGGTALDYHDSQGNVLGNLEKRIGSDLTGLYQGIHDLERFIAEPKIETD